MKHALLLLAAALLAVSALAETPANLVAENIPPFDPQLVERVTPYLEYRTAGFNGWHPERREMIVSTRFGDTSQLHVVAAPGGARRQITFFSDRVGGGDYQNGTGRYIVFSKDIGGGEFYQIYRYDPQDGSVVLLTDGNRATGADRCRTAAAPWRTRRRDGRGGTPISTSSISRTRRRIGGSPR